MAGRLKRASARSGFSLVECLVAMAVVAVLAFLLFGLIGRGQDAAHMTECVGNLRSLHLAAMNWVRDHDHRMPDARYWQDDSSKAARRKYQLAPYLEMGQTTDQEGAAGEWAKWKSAFKCPVAHRLAPSQSAWARTYTINGYAISTLDGVPRETADYPRSLRAIERPSLMALFMDGAPQGGGSYRSSVKHTNVSPSFQFPHAHSLNVVFVDGSVRNIADEEMLREYTTPSHFWHYAPPH